MALEPKIIPCTRHCFGGMIGMDNCNVCGRTGSMFLANGETFPNTETGYHAAVRAMQSVDHVVVLGEN